MEDFFDSPVDAAGDALDVCGGGGADVEGGSKNPSELSVKKIML